MNTEQYQFIKNILDEAEQLDQHQQASFVKAACKQHPEFVKDIMAMLAIGQSDKTFDMDQPALFSELGITRTDAETRITTAETALSPGSL
ncbi:MAG: hypothetical protein ACWA5R_12135, partial [bacterium]